MYKYTKTEIDEIIKSYKDGDYEILLKYIQKEKPNVKDVDDVTYEDIVQVIYKKISEKDIEYFISETGETGALRFQDTSYKIRELPRIMENDLSLFPICWEQPEVQKANSGLLKNFIEKVKDDVPTILKVWNNTIPEIQEVNADLLPSIVEYIGEMWWKIWKKEMPSQIQEKGFETILEKIGKSPNDINYLWATTLESVKKEKIDVMLEFGRKNPRAFLYVWNSLPEEVRKENNDLFELIVNSEKNDRGSMRYIWNHISRVELDANSYLMNETLDILSEDDLVKVWSKVPKNIQSEKFETLLKKITRRSEREKLLQYTYKDVIFQKLNARIDLLLSTTIKELPESELISFKSRYAKMKSIFENMGDETLEKVNDDTISDMYSFFNIDIPNNIVRYWGVLSEDTQRENFIRLVRMISTIRENNIMTIWEIWKTSKTSVQNENFVKILDLFKGDLNSIDKFWMSAQQDIIQENLDDALNIIGMSEKKDLLLELAATNEDICRASPRILEDKYIKSFGKNKINQICSYQDVVIKLLEIGDSENGDKKLTFLAKCIEQFQKETGGTEEWTPYANRILKNVDSYSKLIEDVDITTLTAENLSKMTNLIIHENIYEIEKVEQLTDIKQKEKDKCEMDIMSNDIKSKQKAVLISKLGFTLEEAEELNKKFGEDIEAIRDDDLKYFVKSVKAILEMTSEDDKKLLENIYRDVEPIEHRNQLKIERMLKTEYGRLFNEGLFKSEQGKIVESNVFEAGTDFRMIVTSVAAYRNNDPDNYYVDWNRCSLGSQHFCASYIRNDMIGTAPIPHLCYGFSEMSDDALMLSGNSDIYSSGVAFESTSERDEAYYTPNSQIDKTNYYNEMCFRRFQCGKKKQPDYIVVFRNEGQIPNIDEARKASIQFKSDERFPNGLPIVVVDVDKCLEEERRKVEKMIKDFNHDPTIEKAKRIKQKIRNNKVSERKKRTKKSEKFGDEFDLTEVDKMCEGTEEKKAIVTVEELRQNDDSVTLGQKVKTYQLFTDISKRKNKNYLSSTEEKSLQI